MRTRRHIVLTENPHIKSMAALVLLTRELRPKELEKWLKFRDEYLTEILKEFGDLVCKYCGKRNLLKDTTSRHKLATIDHIIPLSKGGPRYDKDNLAVACSSCNQKKADKDIL